MNGQPWKVEFYHTVSLLKLPRHLKDQLSRAASSISLNLAEGSGRSTNKDQLRFYHIALGSLRECQAVLDLVDRDETEIRTRADILGAHLYRLIQSRN